MKYFYSLLLCTMVLSISSNAQVWPLTDKLTSSDKEQDDNLGFSSSISGNYAIAGAWHEDHDASGSNMMSNSGAAYIYRYDTSTKTWTQEAKIVASDRSANAEFGYAVSISGTYAVVTAVRDSASSGAAYVFERNGSGTWVQVKKLVATSRRANDRFGVSVAISGNNIIVGAHHEDEDPIDANTIQNAGSAYIYTRTSGIWGIAQKIAASDRNVNDEFGISVGIDGDNAIIGAYRHDGDTASKEKGAAYAFKYAPGSGMWVEQKILQAATRFHQDRFGWSVDVSGNYYMVGAPRHNLDSIGGNAKLNAGAAYIFDESNSWAEAKIVATDRADQDNYGERVAISDTQAIVGAPLQNFGPPGETPPVLRSDGGAAYALKRNADGTWSQTKKLIATTADRFASDKLGSSVDIDGDVIIVGAPEDNLDSSAPKPSIGAVYIYRRDTTTPPSSVSTNIRKNISVYPNPVNSTLNIELTEQHQQVEVNIYDVTGRIVLSNSYNNERNLNIDLSRIPSGAYILDISTETKHQQLRHRLLKL